MIKILVADNHTIIREGVKKILSNASDMFVAGEAANEDETMSKIRGNNYNVAVMDLSVPNNGLDLLKQIKTQKPGLNVLVLSIHTEKQYATRVLKAGADGYLTKACSEAELLSAVRAVSLGKKYVSQSFAEQIASDLRDDTAQPPHVKLSNREFQVMSLIAAGEAMKEIAYSMALSSKTVSTYRSRILDKMKLKNNAAIIHYAVRHGLIH